MSSQLSKGINRRHQALVDHLNDRKDDVGVQLLANLVNEVILEHGEGKLPDRVCLALCRKYETTIAAIAQATSNEEAFLFVRSRCRTLHKRLPTNKYARALVDEIAARHAPPQVVTAPVNLDAPAPSGSIFD